MKRYVGYRPLENEYLHEIPKHWSFQPLVSLAETFNSSVDKKMYEDEVPVRLCNYTDVYYNDLITGQSDYMPATASTDQIQRFSVKAGDVVITKDSESADDIGISAFVPETLPGIVYGYHLTTYRPLATSDGRFLKRLFDSRFVKAELQTRTLGVTRVGLSQNTLRYLRVPVPPLEEQRAIADFLDRETAEIDAFIADQERLIELLTERRTATITHAVTKGLDPNAPMRDSGIPWLGHIPAHWTMCSLKNLGSIRYGIGEPPRYHDQGTPLIRATNVKQGKIVKKNLVFVDAEDIPSAKRVVLQQGDILVVRSGALTGDSAIIPLEYAASIAGFDMVFRPKAGVNSSFIAMNLLADNVKRAQIDQMRMRAAQPHLNSDELGSVQMTLPPYPEQSAIARYLEERVSDFDDAIADAKRAIELSKERRAALISAAVTGLIDVRTHA